jgi:hypothetical protein
MTQIIKPKITVAADMLPLEDTSGTAGAAQAGKAKAIKNPVQKTCFITFFPLTD